MFTGIIEDVGTILTVGSTVLTVKTCLGEIRPGDSVAVNGTCLTATRITPLQAGKFTVDFDYSPETGQRTTIKDLKPQARVNLERALKVGDRLGGHFLTGHVETTGTLLKAARLQDSYELAFSLPEDLRKYVVSKGSIGIDGISLTVADRNEASFTVAVIPHTMEHTTLHYKKAGDQVNLEPDILAKYVENIMESKKKGLTMEFLGENGYL